MGQKLRRSVRIVLAGVALSMLVSACGESDQALFDQALEGARSSIAADELEEAEEQLDAAGQLRPDDPEFRAARRTLNVILASREVFQEAQRLAAAGRLLAARDAFLEVSESDVARFEVAQAAAISTEERWLDDIAARFDDLLLMRNVDGLVQLIHHAREEFDEPALTVRVIEPRGEQVLQVLADVGVEMISEEQFNNIDTIVRQVTAIYPLSDSQASAAVREMSEFAASERTRVTRIRSEEAARRQQEALQALQPSRPAAPTRSGECPSPVTDPDGFRSCLDARLAEVPRDTGATTPVPTPTPIQPPEPVGPTSCPSFDPGVRASLSLVTGTLTEDRYGTRRLELSFDGSITNVSVGQMRVFLHSYVLYYGDQAENHPGRRTRLTAVDGSQEGGWLAPGAVQRFVIGDEPPLTVGSEPPTHIEFNVGVNLRADPQPEFCRPDGDWYFDSVRASISY